jgi:hypothetical protein
LELEPVGPAFFLPRRWLRQEEVGAVTVGSSQVPIGNDFLSNVYQDSSIDNNSCDFNVQPQFEAGRIKYFVQKWEEITSDPVILDIVQHYHIEFYENWQGQQAVLPNMKFGLKEQCDIDETMQKLLEKRVIQQVGHCPGEFISGIFVTPKKDGSSRMILNLKKLNEGVQYHHFKMDTLASAIKLVTPGCFFRIG